MCCVTHVGNDEMIDCSAVCSIIEKLVVFVRPVGMRTVWHFTLNALCGIAKTRFVAGRCLVGSAALLLINLSERSFNIPWALQANARMSWNRPRQTPSKFSHIHKYYRPLTIVFTL